jgi:hypothetical protein
MAKGKQQAYTPTLPAPYEGYWEIARLTLSSKDFNRLVAEVVTGVRVFPVRTSETVKVVD